MEISKRMIKLLALGMVLSCYLTACSHSSDIPTTQENFASDAEDAVEEEHDEITIASLNQLFTESFFDIFHQKYPEINLKIQNYAGTNGSGYAMYSLANGDIPDIYVTTQNFFKDAQEEYLLDLSNYDFVNNYSHTLLTSLDINGGIYLLPSGYQLTGIYYNKTILEDNGWKVPNSFQELVELSKKIEAAGYRTMGHGMNPEGFPFNYFFNIGNTVYFGTPEGTEWKTGFPKGEKKAKGNVRLQETAEYFKKWVDEGFITTEHMSSEQFYEGECVFFLCLGLNQFEHTTETGKNYTFGTIPWLSQDGSNNMLTRSVTRYMGIHKTLAEEGNEQKLKDALTVLRYISTVEGQRALMSNSPYYMPSLNEAALPADSPYQEIVDLVYEGRTVPLVYVGWEQLVIPIAQDIKQLIEGKIGTDELLAAFDTTNDNLLYGDSDDIYAIVEKTLTMEETARLAAIAEGKSVDADCAMISLNSYHGDDKFNNQGLGWYLYQGFINMDMIHMIRPRAATISVLEMTGAEIKAMQAGGFDLQGDGNPYEYLLFTKGDKELADNTVYKLAISTGELTEEMRIQAEETAVSPTEAIGQYLKELKTVSVDRIRWE